MLFLAKSSGSMKNLYGPHLPGEFKYSKMRRGVRQTARVLVGVLVVQEAEPETETETDNLWLRAVFRKWSAIVQHSAYQ